MAINIKFDLVGNPEPPTIILTNRNGNRLGQLYVDEKSIDIKDCFNDASEFSFTLNKYIDGKLTPLWEKVSDFKLVYCKEWDMYFEIKVELDESTETVKTVFCTQLGQAELSQIMLYDVEINTEDDIARDDYKISILYDENNPKSSILDRLLEKAPHYSIAHVDPTIAKIQRSFSFDDVSICDAHQEIAEEIGCLFVYPSNSGENGKIQRDIFVYDLQQNCNDCGHRGEFTHKCPKCGSTNIKYGYGEDTLIFVTADELASEGIQMTTDTESVKNCFKLEAGDDLMTATVRNCNPNGSDYIWHFSESLKEDMSDKLVRRLNSYDDIYKIYNYSYESIVDEKLLDEYNMLVSRYSVYNKNLQPIEAPIVGYAELMNAYYNVIDLALYLESGLMPSVEMSGTTAEEQVNLLTSSSLSPVAVADITTASLPTVNSAVLAMAKTIVRPTYKVQIDKSEIINEGNSKIWSGNFIVENYSDEEDVFTGNTVSVEINDDLEAFVNQKLDKVLNKENTDDLSISGLFEKEYDDFCNELKKYALNPLIRFHDACQACIDILIEQGVADGGTWSGDEDSETNLYDGLYTPYYNKLIAIESEINIRESEIGDISGVYDSDGNLISEGLMTSIEDCRNKIQSALNFKDYLGDELWLEFCSYRREDSYSNDNYISDGLNNAELFKRALEFFEVAENEIYKSSELQHSISTTLNNLLAITKFKPLVKYFNVGNWIRVLIDDKIYKLRLLEYEIDFGDFNNISVEFSDVTKIKNSATDIESVLSQASSMASSYDSVKRQANKGNEARSTVDDWITNGLNTALVQIQNNDNEDITVTKNGLLGRSYDEITGSYSPEQIRLTHNIIAYTDDNWQTVRQAIGKHKYNIYSESENSFVEKVGYGLSADFVTAGIVSGSQIVGGDIYSDNYSVTERAGSYLNLRDGTFSFGGGTLRYEGGKLIISSPDIPTTDRITEINEEYLKTTSVYAQNLQVSSANIDGKLIATQIDTKGLIAENISGDTITGKNISGGYLLIGDKSGTYSEIDTDGTLTCTNGIFSGKISGSTFESSSGGNFSIDDQGLISGKNLMIEEDISTQTINCTSISNAAYPKTLTSSPTIYVNANSGDDFNECVNGAVFQTLQGAINSIPKFMNGRNVYIELQTNITENVEVRYCSSGQIYIYLCGYTVYGYIRTTSCSHLLVFGGTKNGKGVDVTGTIHPSTGVNIGGYIVSVAFAFNCSGYIQNVKVYGADNLVSETSSRATIAVEQGAFLYAIGVGIVNTDVGFRANAGGRIYVSESNGVASSYGFVATTGGYISLNSNSQSGGMTENTIENYGGFIKQHSPMFETGNSSSSDSKAPTEKIAKNITYTSSVGNSIQYYGGSSAKWRSDNSPKVGTWGHGNHVAFWFFDDNFENVANKDVTKIDITFTRNTGGYSSSVKHNFYVHNYESQPSTKSPSFGSTLIGSASVETGKSTTFTITDSTLIGEIISNKGICSIPPSQSQAYYSVMSGTMKIKFYYTE